MTPGQAEWKNQTIELERPNVARVYDYWLGGSHIFLPDQDLGRAMAAVEPNTRAIARANRAFMGRAVRFLAGTAGVRQFLDIGSGIPAEGNVHEIAQRACPRARVAYVDIDPIAVAAGRDTLCGNHRAIAVEGDLRDPKHILTSERVGKLIDFGRPVALLLVSVLHFLGDDDDPWGIVATLRDALAPGSYLVLSHATDESRPSVVHAAQCVFRRGAKGSGRARSRAEIERFFDGFGLTDPGLVYVPRWRPDSPADVPADPGQFWFLVGVGRKPAAA
jgi:SAM-dependent methyltransferase